MDSREQLEYMVKNMAARLSTGWTGEQDEYGEYRNEDGYPTSAGEFLTDSLNLEFTVDHELEFRGASIWTTVGGADYLGGNKRRPRPCLRFMGKR